MKNKRMKKERPPVEIALETASTVRDAAVRAERVARRLLRRTRFLTSQATRKLPPLPSGPTLAPAPADAGHITLALPDISMPVHDEHAAQAREIAALRARAERAEHAAAWLRARLRTERARAATQPQLDVAALAADLTRGLAAAQVPNPEAVRRVVQRTLAAHGLPVETAPARENGAAQDTSASPWPRDQQEALARLVVARAPEVADPAYVHRVVGLIAQRGRLTLGELTRAAGYNSAMARRRLRLTVEALAALGALTIRDGAYSLNPQWKPPAPPMPSRGPAGRQRYGSRSRG